MLYKRSSISQSLACVSAAFSIPSRKSRPQQRTTISHVHTHSADSRPGFTLQTRPLSSDGIIALFKGDPHKKQDKEQNAKVGIFSDLGTSSCG